MTRRIRRKRSRGLGSSPLEHGNEAKAAEKRALASYIRMARSVVDGDCKHAYEELDQSRFFMGQARAHRDAGAADDSGKSIREAYLTPGLARQADISHEMFERSCLVKKRTK